MSQTFTVYLLPLWLFCLHLTVTTLPPSMGVSTRVFYGDECLNNALKVRNSVDFPRCPSLHWTEVAKDHWLILRSKTLSITVSDISFVMHICLDCTFRFFINSHGRLVTPSSFFRLCMDTLCKVALSASPGVVLGTAETQLHTINRAHLMVKYGRKWRVHRFFWGGNIWNLDRV